MYFIPATIFVMNYHEHDERFLFYEYEHHVCECLNVYDSTVDCILYTFVYVFKFLAFYIMFMGGVFLDC